jgi:DNA repair protein RadC
MQQLTLAGFSPADKESDARPGRLLLRELPVAEQPVERLHKYGPGALSNAELIEVLLGAPEAMGRELLSHFEGMLGLARASTAELQGIQGLGKARAARLKAALELGRRQMLDSPKDLVTVKSPADAAQMLLPEMRGLEQEELWVLILDTRNHVLAVDKVYRGSLNTAIVRVGEIFREAIKRNAAAVIIAHSHPSGDPTPSPEDVRVTETIVQAGKLLDIETVDHLIIGDGYVSLRERGLGFQ